MGLSLTEHRGIDICNISTERLWDLVIHDLVMVKKILIKGLEMGHN